MVDVEPRPLPGAAGSRVGPVACPLSGPHTANSKGQTDKQTVISCRILSQLYI